MRVDIYIKEADGKREIRIPWLPDKISCSYGEVTMASYDILNRGEVVKPTGVGLATYSWESIFPGLYREDTGMLRGKYYPPSHYKSILRQWMENGTKLTLIVLGCDINTPVYITNFTTEASGGFGDFTYNISFKQARTIRITSTKVKKQTTTSRSDTKLKSESYVVKKGDTLWSIARAKLGNGALWTTIYKTNKAIIESTAKKHGLRGSENGHWIFPGTKLVIGLAK